MALLVHLFVICFHCYLKGSNTGVNISVNVETLIYRHINRSYQRNKYKTNILLFWEYNQYRELWFKLTKKRQEVVQKYWYLLPGFDPKNEFGWQ